MVGSGEYMIPLNDGTDFVPLDSDIEVWKKAYPAINVQAELNKMAAWSHSNKEKRKTRRGITKFINTWLSKAQDKGGSGDFNKWGNKELPRHRPIEDYGNFSCTWELGEAMIRAYFKKEGFKPPKHLVDYRPKFNISRLIEIICAQEPTERQCYSAFWVTLVRNWNRQSS